MKKKYKFIFTGGGSGGHTMPALAMIRGIKDYFKNKNVSCSIFYIGSHNGVEKGLIVNNNVEYQSISTGKFRRYLSLNNFIDIFKIIIGIKQSKKIIKNFNPDILISTGGFVSVPPVIAAKQLKIPILIHEQTIDAGLANKIASKFADKIALTFNESKKYFLKKDTILTGNPIRKELFSGNKRQAFNKFNLDKKLPVIYFTGGGLGCHILNLTAMKILPRLLEKCNVIFQTGKALNSEDYLNMKKLKVSLDIEKKKRLIVFDFINDDLADIYALTDLAITRSGAGTVNELMALNIPAIFIPLAIATKNEQLRNAKYVEKIGGSIIIEEKDLNSEILFSNINDILFTDRMKKMKEDLKKHSIQDGTKNMIDLIIEIIGK